MTVAVPHDRLSWMYANPALGEAVRDILSNHRPDIFHLFSGYLMTVNPLWAALDLQIPVAVSLTDYWYLCPRLHLISSKDKLCNLIVDPVECVQCLAEEKRRFRWPGRIFPKMWKKYWRKQNHQVEETRRRLDVLRRVLNQANVLISPSQFIASVYEGNGFHGNRMIYMRQGVESSLTEAVVKEKKPSTDLRIGFIGQIVHVKGIHTLLEAVQKLSSGSIRLKLVGDYNRDPKYAKGVMWLSRSMPVEWYGKFDHKDLHLIFHEIDVLVVPSLWYENSPNVILESLAYLTPVIGSNVGGIPELVIHEQNGLLFEPGDSSDLATQINRLMTEPKLLGQLRDGIHPVKKLEEEIDELEEVYRSICK